MASAPGRGLLHLAAAVDLPGAYDAEPYVELTRLAERGGLDFVTLDDTFARPGPDATAVLARVAPATHRVGLAPTVAAADPDRARAAITTLDWISRGRAGRWIDLAAEDGEREAGSAPPGERPVLVVDATEEAVRRAAARHADVALVRVTSPAQARAVREQLRSDAAEFGRDPGGLRILVSLLVDLGAGEHAAEPGHGGGGPRPTPRGPLYRGGPVDLAELIVSWHQEGTADGFHLIPVEPHRDLERLVNGTVALLQHRGLFRTFYPGSTLREHLGLTRTNTGPRTPRKDSLL
ncbi:LLM class flavin-dependent oxidoreductase [Streptomyces antibioticus]|uniref:LLM class flavin-dependent oxidoreductase n=1 Tax=Streptomyces TaxID=1883 RepID=UPI0015875497|nr:LLM class flavin-dependent oxidoreductase [Streptomyces sp. CAI-85]NUV61822.1 LLM class flavin-dependent oxidoreductase [Streptomyces sp. CAI-85]